MSSSPASALDDLLAGIQALTGRSAGSTVRRGFERYLAVFLRWNRTHRMTALSPAGIVRELFLDALLFLPLLPPRPLRMVDIGAGAGIPGLPLRLADPSIRLTLVESRRKRVSFLRAVQRELELDDVAVVEGRAEGIVAGSDEFGESFDVAVARSVGPADGLLPVARRFLRTSGIFIVSGPPDPIPCPGFEVARVPRPSGRGSRTFLRARKEG